MHSQLKFPSGQSQPDSKATQLPSSNGRMAQEPSAFECTPSVQQPAECVPVPAKTTGTILQDVIPRPGPTQHPEVMERVAQMKELIAFRESRTEAGPKVLADHEKETLRNISHEVLRVFAEIEQASAEIAKDARLNLFHDLEKVPLRTNIILVFLLSPLVLLMPWSSLQLLSALSSKDCVRTCSHLRPYSLLTWKLGQSCSKL